MRESFAEALEGSGVIAIFRGVPSQDMVDLARALIDAGITLMEVALSETGASGKLQRLDADLGSAALIGAGTVTSGALAEEALGRGARFLVTPYVVPEVNALGRERGVPVLGGAMTPTEIATARRQGNEYVKVFPAGSLGPSYIRALLGPDPGARLVAVGGVGVDNAGAFIRAGAVGVAVGGALTGAAVRGRGAAGDAARRLLDSVRAAKEQRT